MIDNESTVIRVNGTVVPARDNSNQSDIDSLIDELFKAVRYGFKSHVERILNNNKEIIDRLDSDGYSCVHWACKKGHDEILVLLHSLGANLSIVSTCEARMLPIHWAASDGKISILRYLINHTNDMNALDGCGCSPLLIATQHNQINAVIFLTRNGCDATLKDDNGDSCLHWAAYKGLVELTAYLIQLVPYELNNPDNFGQTPLHLAALKNHYECVVYFTNDCKADLLIRDKNGSTPFDLSFKKNHSKIEWFFRCKMSKSYFQLIRGLGASNIFKLKYLSMLFFGGNESEFANWAWRTVFISNLVGTIITFQIALNDKFSDLYLLHQTNVILQFLWWIMFFMCLFRSPGLVVDNHSDGNRYSYDKGLEEIASIGAVVVDIPNLCHTCRVRRPLRSKHCKILRHCVYKFDHFCPFVGNTVGRDNYKYFFAVLALHFLCSIFWYITVGFILRRTRISWMFSFYIMYTFGWFLMILGLLRYHVQLSTFNITTNEYINVDKYAYLKDDYASFNNSFDQKSIWKNFIASLFSNEVVYFKSQINYI